MSIPANIDHQSIITDLNRRGLRDFKLEIICGFSNGYIAQLKSGNIKQMNYQRAARLYNFHLAETELRASRETAATYLDSHSLVATTT